MHKNFSERTAELIDEEIKKIIDRNFERTRKLLEANKSKLKKIAKLLLEKEVISSDEINAIAKVRKPKAPRAKSESKIPPAAAPAAAPASSAEPVKV